MEYAIGIFLALGSVLVTNAPFFVGFVLPPFIEWLNRDVPKERDRRIVAIVTCGIVGLLLSWPKIAYGTPEQAVAFIGSVFADSHTVFKLYFQRSFIRETIQDRIGSVREYVPPQTNTVYQ